jgi:hypothetical protein
MNSNDQGIKRARTQQQDGAGGADNLPGREQLLLSSPELQTRLGRKYCDETELLPLLLAHGFLRRVRTIQVEMSPLGGDSFKITLDASNSTVCEAKAEIARSQGTAAARQELYRVAERADGLAVREDDAEPELLDDEGMLLRDGDVVAMAVKVSGYLTYENPASFLTCAFNCCPPWNAITRSHRCCGGHFLSRMLRLVKMGQWRRRLRLFMNTLSQQLAPS